MKRNKEYRIEQEERIINNRKTLLKSVTNYPNGKLLEEPHRMAKQHPFDCGKPNCPVCHSEKAGFGSSYNDLKEQSDKKLLTEELSEELSDD